MQAEMMTTTVRHYPHTPPLVILAPLPHLPAEGRVLWDHRAGWSHKMEGTWFPGWPCGVECPLPAPHGNYMLVRSNLTTLITGVGGALCSGEVCLRWIDTQVPWLLLSQSDWRTMITRRIAWMNVYWGYPHAPISLPIRKEWLSLEVSNHSCPWHLLFFFF